MDTVKIVSSSAIAFAIDKFLLKNPDIKHNASFAISTGVGIGLGSLLGSVLPDMNMKFANGKAVMSRVAEVGLGAGTSWYVNKYIMGNSSWNDDAKKQILSIIATDLLGEYISDYMNNRPLSAFE